MAFFHIYLDESDSHDGAPALCVAAYLFEKVSCEKLDLEWKAVLDEFSLPYFHMVDCAHGTAPFDKLSKDQRIEVQTRLIASIRTHMLFGAVTAVNEAEYNTWGARQEVGSAYSYACWMTIAAVNAWMDQQGLGGKIAYFFETGHKSGTETHDIMTRLASTEEHKTKYRYGAHSFVDKATVRPVQTADIFAWLHSSHIKRLRRGELTPRKDYAALVNDRPHRAFFADSASVSPTVVSGHPELKNIVPSWVRK